MGEGEGGRHLCTGAIASDWAIARRGLDHERCVECRVLSAVDIALRRESWAVSCVVIGIEVEEEVDVSRAEVVDWKRAQGARHEIVGLVRTFDPLVCIRVRTLMAEDMLVRLSETLCRRFFRDCDASASRSSDGCASGSLFDRRRWLLFRSKRRTCWKMGVRSALSGICVTRNARGQGKGEVLLCDMKRNIIRGNDKKSVTFL